MAVTVIIPTPLRVYAGKKQSTEVKAGSVGDALTQLTSEFAELKRHLFTEDGQLRSFVNVYLNDEDIRYLAKDKTITKDGDTVSIVPSIAGGCQAEKVEKPERRRLTWGIWDAARYAPTKAGWDIWQRIR
jgi:molybdopterin converting factor small subunit